MAMMTNNAFIAKIDSFFAVMEYDSIIFVVVADDN
jgi:hypothetical protein